MGTTTAHESFHFRQHSQGVTRVFQTWQTRDLLIQVLDQVLELEEVGVQRLQKEGGKAAVVAGIHWERKWAIAIKTKINIILKNGVSKQNTTSIID